jgi:hypothetical protein
MLASGHQSAATLRRLAFRLAIVLVLSALWPGDSPARAAGILCFLFSAAVLWTAYAWSERPAGHGLSRWHEGAFLLVLGLLLFFWFGRDMASDHRSSVEGFSGIQLADARRTATAHRASQNAGAWIGPSCSVWPAETNDCCTRVCSAARNR